MLTLAVARLPRADRTSWSEVWRDRQGAVCAYGGNDDDGSGFWLRVPGIGVFVIPSVGEVVLGEPETCGSGELLEDAFRRTVLPLALQARGLEVLHASAVYDSRGVVGLCGISGTGKSTLAANLTSFGCEPFADDALAFSTRDDDQAVEAISVPFVLSVDDATSVLLPRVSLPPHAPLRAICVLERGAGKTVVHRIGASEAFTEVLRHAYAFTLADFTRTALLVNGYFDLVERVPVLRVRFAPDPARIQELAATVHEAVEARCST